MTLILDRWTVGYHKDLADLHMKYDVTKQEINFFQSKLKARNQNDMTIDDNNTLKLILTHPNISG